MSLKSRISIAWKATRPFAFPASAIPVLLGTSIAWTQTNASFKPFRFIVTLVGIMAIHAGANIFNDYFDFKSNVDRKGTLGSSGLLIEGRITPERLFRMGIVWYLVGAAAGAYLVFASGWWVLWLGLIGVAGGYFYTTGPALKYRALGDVSVILLFGILITLGAYYVQTGYLDWLPVLYAIPVGLLVDGILHGNNIRDIETDAEVGVVTLAGRMGLKGSRLFYIGLVVGAFLSIPVLVFGDHLPWPCFIVFLSFPLAVRNIRMVRKHQTTGMDEGFAMIDALGAQLQLAFGMLLIIGVCIGRWVS